MAILAFVVSPEIKKEQYDLARNAVDWNPNEPQGLLFHAAGFDASGGVHIADVWSSKDAMDKFFATRLLPVLRTLSISPPKIEIYPLYFTSAGPGVIIERFAIQR